MSALADALNYAARSGPVHVSVGRAAGGNVINVKGGQLRRYLRVGAAPANVGARVIVMKAGARHIVFTGVTVIDT